MNFPEGPQDVGEYGIAPLIALGLGIPAILGATFVGYQAVKPSPNAPPPRANVPIGATINQAVLAVIGIGAVLIFLDRKAKRGR